MFVIRDAQMKAFEEDLRERFEREMVAHLNSRFTLEQITAHQRLPVSDLVHTAVDTALSRGITAHDDVRRFLELSVEHGLGFENQAWARTVLADESLSGTEKMDQLDGHTTFALR
jgi:hypothetical protein